MVTGNEIIYNLMVNLSSRCVDKVDPLGLYDGLVDPLCASEPIKGLVTPPYQYQRAAVIRMLHQELYPLGYALTLGELLWDTYSLELWPEPIAYPYNCGNHHYSPVINPLLSTVIL